MEIRPWRLEDASALLAAWTDPEIARWNPVPSEPTLEQAEHWIRGASQQTASDVGVDMVMDLDGEVIGEIGLQIDWTQRIGEVGFWIGHDHRGKGRGATMLHLAAQLGERLKLRGLVALVDPANGVALALLERNGWTEVPTSSRRRAFAVRLGSLEN